MRNEGNIDRIVRISPRTCYFRTGRKGIAFNSWLGLTYAVSARWLPD